MPLRRAAAHPRTGGAELPDDRYPRTLDPWVALATAATVTSRIILGTAVALPAVHDPIIPAKTIASLDHLTGGRVLRGAGFGWNTDELADHRVPGNRRRTVLAEHLAAMRAIWSTEQASYHDDFVSFDPCWSWPKPLSNNGIPVVLGAGGSEGTFAWLAKHADGWMTTPVEGELASKIEALHRAWQAAQRPGEPEILALAGRLDPAQLDEWAALGVTEAIFGLPDRTAAEVRAYLDRLAGKLSLPV